MRRRKLSSLLFAAIALAGAPAARSEQATVRLDRLVASFDPAVWHLSRRTDGDAVLSPTEAWAQKQDPIRLLRRETRDLATTCRTIADENWRGDHYGQPRSTPTTLGGRAAIRLTVSTGCRNATPTGLIVCTSEGDAVYAVMLLNAIPTCRAPAGVLFAPATAFEALLAAIRFTD